MTKSKRAFPRLFRKTVAATSIAAAAGMGIFATPASAQVPLKQKRQTRSPNILYIVADDLGYSDLSAFGGEISTPNLDELVRSGRILTNFHTSTVSAVTRAMMYSGTDHHLVGEGTMGAPRDERAGLPGYEGYLNDRALCIAQLLRDGGYHTYMTGKWHLGSDISKGQAPDAWGFEHSYVLLSGNTMNHFGHETAGSRSYASDGRYVQPGQPGQPGGDGTEFYDTDFYTQQLIRYIDMNKGDGRPFLAFATYTSPHWPLQVPEPYLNKYKGVYDVGYDVIRARRFEQLKALGLIPKNFTENPGLPNALVASPATPNYGTPPARYLSAVHNDPSYVDYGPGKANPTWDSLSEDRKKLFARYMEIYAGMVDNLDHNVGLLIQHLKDIGEYDNTFIIFHSDNGSEGWPGSIFNPAQDDINMQPANFVRLGQSGSWVQYGLRWAEVSATPFKLFKAFTTEGGVSVPTIVHMPGQVEQAPTLDSFFHITDVVPTILDMAHIDPPTEPAPPLIDPVTGVDKNAGKVIYDGRYVYPISGLSMLQHLEGLGRGPLHTEPVGEEIYGRTFLVHGPWKAVWIDPPWGPVDGHWQLYNLEIDRGEVNDLSAHHPGRLQNMIYEWNEYMKKVGGVEPLQPKAYY